MFLLLWYDISIFKKQEKEKYVQNYHIKIYKNIFQTELILAQKNSGKTYTNAYKKHILKSE